MLPLQNIGWSSGLMITRRSEVLLAWIAGIAATSLHSAWSRPAVVQFETISGSGK